MGPGAPDLQMHCGRDETPNCKTCSVPRRPPLKREGRLRSENKKILLTVNAMDRQMETVSGDWGCLERGGAESRETEADATNLQRSDGDVGFNYYTYYYYYCSCFIIAYDFQCQNSAGQLCVVSAGSTLHTFCSKYISVVKGNALHVVFISVFCTFFFFLNCCSERVGGK